MLRFKEFRNVFYYRTPLYSVPIRWLCPPLPMLRLKAKEIGGGLKIQHGFSSCISAQHIGTNCHIFQQVTIGFNGNKIPTIGNNVTVCCGAKIIGDVKVGNNVTVGANAVVTKDIPDNAVVVGIPAHIIKYKPSVSD